MKSHKPTKRTGYWYLIRRIPVAVAHLDQRTSPIKISTHIAVADDPRGIRAQAAVARINADLAAYWSDLLAGKDVAKRREYEAARKAARALGVDYVSNQDLALRDALEIVRRYEALEKRDVESTKVTTAMLGGVRPPEFTVAGLFDEYEALSRASLSDMSDDQLRKWRNPKKRALSNLIDVIGDKPLNCISRSDALDFRDWWQSRIVDEGIDIGTANKDIGHLNKMVRLLNDAHRLNLELPFSSLRISGERGGQRTAYTEKFVQEKILVTGIFDDLNVEARRILYLICETGLRLSEACNLTRDTILLGGSVPHVKVRAIGRRLKTDQSERDIPLVGVALDAMQFHPEGFPRYRDKSASLSALVNKALNARCLRPEGQSIYLRTPGIKCAIIWRVSPI